MVISLQENHQTHNISQSEDGCTFVKKSGIFFHIMNEDNDLEIMCELGYNKSNKMCGNGRFNSTIHIPIETQGRYKQVLVYTTVKASCRSRLATKQFLADDVEHSMF